MALMSGQEPAPFKPPLPPRLSDEERRTLSRRARAAVRSLVLGEVPVPPLEGASGALQELHGVFVTLRLGDDLRGCIGTLAPRRPLADAVVEYAQASAARDPRFPPVTPEELPLLEVEISVLSPLVRLTGDPETFPRLVEVGRHGLQIEWGEHRGLLLPQVASRWEATAEEFLGMTAEKAGLYRDAWREPDARVSVFTAEVFPAERP